MSHAPTVFISAATIDLRYLRDLLAKVFEAAQFRVIVQDKSLGAPLGNVRDMLVADIVASDCVIHLAGTGYGGEATKPFPLHPDFRCSWTQFEYYHAHSIGKPVLALVCAPDLSRFGEDQAGKVIVEPEDKSRLQHEHRERITKGKFDGTPLAGQERTLNLESIDTMDDLLVHVGRMVGTLQREFGPAAVQVQEAIGKIRLLHTIPPPPAGFTGRVADLDALRRLFTAAARPGALITGLKGMGGIGKTALALVLAREWAPRFPDAALFLDGRGLAGDAAPSADRLMEQVIRAFHPEAGQLPDDPAQLAATYRGVLHGKNALLLLDNAKDAAQAKPLLPPAGCALIVTSRTGFPLDGIAPHPVGRMTDPEAAELLRASYDKLSPAELAELIRLCAGLPLALRLAAAHLALDAADRQGSADVAAYLAKLRGGRLAGLDADAEEFAETTISETLRLSVEPLPEAERRAWQNLAIFPAPFDALAAQTIAGADEEMLARFLRRSLLESNGPDGRYRLHDLAADYARGNLSPAEQLSLAHAHAGHFQAVAYTANALYLNDEVLAGLELFDRERAQIEAAFAAMSASEDNDEAAAQRVIGLADATVYVGQDLRFHPRQRITWLEHQLRAARLTGEREAEGSALGNLGNAHAAVGDARKAIGCYEQHLEITREIGDRGGEGSALGNLGTAHAALGDARKAIGYHEQGLAITREIGDRRSESNALGNLGIAHSILGDARKAIEFYEQSVKINREIADRRGEGATLGNLGIAHATLGNVPKAIGYHEQHLKIAREMGDRHGEGSALGNIGIAYAALGNAHKAIEFYEQHLEITRENGDRRDEGNALGNLGNAHRSLGDAHKSIRYHEQHLKIAREIGDRLGEGNALCCLGNVRYFLGDARKAIGYYEQHFEIARETGDRRGEGNALWNSALAHGILGEREKAIRLAKAALANFESIEDPNAEKVRKKLSEWNA